MPSWSAGEGSTRQRTSALCWRLQGAGPGSLGGVRVTACEALGYASLISARVRASGDPCSPHRSILHTTLRATAPYCCCHESISFPASIQSPLALPPVFHSSLIALLETPWHNTPHSGMQGYERQNVQRVHVGGPCMWLQIRQMGA